MKIECRSFGFKYGEDIKQGIGFDVRSLPNPYYIPDLKEKTGQDQEVRDYILGFEQSQTMLAEIMDTLYAAASLNQRMGTEMMTVSFGCTGGKHRSVTFAITVCEALKQKGYDAYCVHRDIDIKD